MIATVRGVRSVDVEVSNLAEASRFYVEVWGLTVVESSRETVCLRGTGHYHHIVALHQAYGVPCVRCITFDARDANTVDQIFDRVRSRVEVFDPPCQSSGPGGGYGFGFKDPEGRNFSVVCGVDDHAGRSDMVSGGPTKIAHVNLNSADWRESARFFTDVLGFRLIDEVPALVFFNCDNPDHHSIVLCKSGGPTINHLSFDMPDSESVMRGAGRMQDHGYPIEWGIGRHGAGNNVFAYFAGPDEFPLEYTAEVSQIDESYVPRGPEYWRFPPGRTDQWGVTAPPTRRLKRIQQLFVFSADGYRLNSNTGLQ